MNADQIVSTATRGPYLMQSTPPVVPQDRNGPEHVVALVDSLRRRARAGVTIQIARYDYASPITLDVIISCATTRIGIICDHSDGWKLSRRPAILDEMFVEGTYLSSALDTIVDPDGVADAIAAREPGLFRSFPRRRKGTIRVSRLPRRSRKSAVVPQPQQLVRAEETEDFNVPAVRDELAA